MKTVILAGGKGTRMGDLVRQVPKPMLRLAGKPILEHQIELARRSGCTEIILLTGHLGQVIEEHFGDGARWDVRIRYHREATALGTAGALKAIQGWLDDDFLVFYADIVMNVDLAALVAFHCQRNALGTLVVHPNSHPYDSDLLEIDAQGRIIAFHPKPHDGNGRFRNLVNAALYVLSPEALRHIPAGRFADLGRDVFPEIVRSGGALYGYRTPEYISDVGTLERLRQVEADVLSGKVARLNCGRARRAIFLDRDGVINVDRDPVARADQLELLPGAAEAVRRINRSEFLAVVVTNQPGVAKGFLSEQELDCVHARLEWLLGAEGAYLDRIYYCPHHPERGLPGERPDYKIPCDCRKPSPGMVLRAAAELNIDLAGSFLIGDRTADIRAGASAGVRTILVRTGCAGGDGRWACEPDFVFDDLREAVDFVMDRDHRPAEAA